MPKVTKRKPPVKGRIVLKKKGAVSKKSSVVSRIGPIVLDRSNLKISVYGNSGTGKTTFACTFPKPLLLIGLEDGTKSVHNVKGVEYVRIDNSGEIKELVDYLHDSRFKTAVLDTATGLQDMVLKELLGLDELPAQLAWGTATREQWGQCALKTKEMLRALLGLPINVVVVAQERAFNSGDGDGEVLMPYVGSALSPSTAGWLNPACDYIVQMFKRKQYERKEVRVGKKKTVRKVDTGKVEFCARTGPDDVYTTKFRVPKGTPLPEVMADPSYAKVIKLLEGV